MLTALASLFSTARSRNTGKNRSSRPRKTVARHGVAALSFQPLEPRLALALTVTQKILTTGPATIAWDIQIDDTVNGAGPLLAGNTEGNGTNAYLQAATDGGSFFLVADNPAFK